MIIPKLASHLRIVAVLLLLLLLAACGTVAPPEAENNERFDLITRVYIDADTDLARLEADSGGSAVVFRPEAGFAILAFEKGAGDLALTNNADPNQDMIATPVANANGWTAWSGGWTAWSGGWTAWSGGWTAWSGGWTAWSGGWTAWSGGATGGNFGENLEAWNQIELQQGQLLAPNLGAGVKVAVIDTGVSLNHPGLSGKLAPASEWMDFVDNDTYPMDEPGGGSTGHGTAVAGIVLQVAPESTILPIRVLSADGSGDVDDVVAGIDHAISVGADVINLSLGTDVDLTTLKTMIDYATAQGIFVTASLGNEGSSDITFPARYAAAGGSTGQYLIGVGSIDHSDNKSGFSNYGTGAEVFTPGEGVYTLTRNDTDEALVTTATGTSFSAPMVAGAVSLALGEAPSTLQKSLLTTHLNTSAMNLDPLNPSYTGQLGHGRIDIEAFLTLMGNSAPNPVKSALLVVNTPPSSSDQYIAERLELLGFAVTMIDDSAASSGSATGKDLVVVSHTVSSGTVGSTFRNVAVPVITWEDGIFETMKMSSGSRGDMSGYDTLTVVSDHPLAAGFSGDTTVYQGTSRLAYATPSASAITVATVPGHADRAVVFAYEAGAEMVGMTAPAKRMGLFFQDYDADSFDYRGVALFEAAVLWSTYDGTIHPVSSTTYLEAVNHSAVEGAFISAGDSNGAGSVMMLPQSVGLNYDGLTTLGRMHYDIDAPAGSYDVWFRVYGPDGGSDSFFVQLDGGDKYALHFGGQGSWRWVKVGSGVPLAGLHTITVSHREGGARLDRILITSDSSFTPSGMGGY